MDFCSIQSCDEKTIAALLGVYTQSTEEIYRKGYAGKYDSAKDARAALFQDYTGFIFKFLEQDDRYIFAVKENIECTAALRIIRMSEYGWYIEALETAPKYRRQGFARYLLKQTLRCMRTLGARNIVSIVRSDNPASRALHLSCGFADTGKTAKDIEGAPIEPCSILEYSYPR